MATGMTPSASTVARDVRVGEAARAVDGVAGGDEGAGERSGDLTGDAGQEDALAGERFGAHRSWSVKSSVPKFVCCHGTRPHVVGQAARLDLLADAGVALLPSLGRVVVEEVELQEAVRPGGGPHHVGGGVVGQRDHGATAHELGAPGLGHGVGDPGVLEPGVDLGVGVPLGDVAGHDDQSRVAVVEGEVDGAAGRVLLDVPLHGVEQRVDVVALGVHAALLCAAP